MQEMISRKAILWFFLAIFLLSSFLLGWLLLPFLSTIVVALVVAGVFSPLYTIFRKRMGPTMASALTCVIIFFVLFIPILLLVGIISKEAYDVYLSARGLDLQNQIQDLIQSSRWVERINLLLSGFNIRMTGELFQEAIPEIGKIVGLFLYEQANAIASNILRFLINFFFMLLIIYFMLIDGNRLISFIMDLSPLPEDQDKKLIGKFKDMAGAILIGNGLCGMIQGILGGTIFAMFGFHSAFLWGVVMALLAFLPILGIGLVFVPAAAYLFLTGRIISGLSFLIFYGIISGGIEYLFKPKLVGRRVQMHTLLVFLSIMGGLKLFGILGIIYGPLVVTAFLTLTDIYHTSYQVLVEPDDRPIKLL